MSPSRWLPLLVGTIAIFVLAGVLAYEDPSPGPLSAAHAPLLDDDRLPGCTVCHAADGLARGCLSCHTAIGAQLERGTGWHAALLADQPEPTCAGCHPEHHGEGFVLAGTLAWGDRGPEDFDHPHVAFRLDGAHDALACEACHRDRRDGPFVLPAFPSHPRETTYLGLDQECASCHDNAHGGPRYRACAECHGQDAFRPTPGFDHGDRFPLDGAHEGVACAGCHAPRPGAPPAVDFASVPGTACADCHETPHPPAWSADCLACHDASGPDWSAARRAVTPARHAETAFSLRPPHDTVACEACHRPGPDYRATFLRADLEPAPGEEEPVAREDRCAACHDDPHAGQFGARPGLCLDCHGREHFVPPRYGRRDHPAVPLAGAHAPVACGDCHVVDAATGVRAFAGTPSACRDCHDDPHGAQFAARVTAGDCVACHTRDRFLPSTVTAAAHDPFPLTGAHRAVSCRACHRRPPAPAPGTAAPPRTFAGTPRRCRDCHDDPHAGQFAARVASRGCVACHDPDARTFAVTAFDHARETGFALRGAHAAAACAQCHATAGDPPVTRWMDTPRDCAACHTDVHRGQFRRGGTVRCDACHRSAARWEEPSFDHTRTRFRLEGSHAGVSCAACHPAVVQPDGAAVVQYRPLSTECRSCHDFDSR